MNNEQRFYVYEHWRPDHDLCFWVGKGTGDRARRFKRNASYAIVVESLVQAGMCVEVRMVAYGLTEIHALEIEEKRIAFWKEAGVALTNRSSGGRGNRSNFVSPETREKIRKANLGKKQSPETRAKRSASLKGHANGGRPIGFRHTQETIDKMRATAMGRIISKEQRKKLRLANLGKTHSPETRAKMSASHYKRLRTPA